MIKWISCIAAVTFLAACNSGGANLEGITLASQTDSVAYSIGVNVGKNMQAQQMEDIDAIKIAAAINDVMNGNDLKISEEEIRGVISTYQKAKMQEVNQKNLDIGEAFLAENKNKEGVFTTESGLQYKILVDGDGPKPKATDVIEAQYVGRTIDGEIFDQSTPERPLKRAANRLIAGWTEALQLMPVGSKWELYIPANLAYGERGSGQSIEPGETLIFELELVDIIEE